LVGIEDSAELTVRHVIGPGQDDVVTGADLVVVIFDRRIHDERAVHGIALARWK
jgi:hypothetical protein